MRKHGHLAERVWVMINLLLTHAEKHQNKEQLIANALKGESRGKSRKIITPNVGVPGFAGVKSVAAVCEWVFPVGCTVGRLGCMHLDRNLKN